MKFNRGFRHCECDHCCSSWTFLHCLLLLCSRILLFQTGLIFTILPFNLFLVIQLYIRVLPVLLVALCNEHRTCFVTNSVWSLYSQFPLCENPNTFVTDSQILAKNIIIYFVGKSIIIGQVEKCYLPRRFSQRCAWLLALVINQ